MNAKLEMQWFTSRSGSSPLRMTRDNHVEVLQDNEQAFGRITEAIRNATSSIYLMQYEFHQGFITTFDSWPTGNSGAPKPRDVLVDLLRDKAERDGVRTCILLNENLLAPDTMGQIHEVFYGTSVLLRGFPEHGPRVMHAKTLTVDGVEAYIIGSIFRQDFWDSSEHPVRDPRRGLETASPKHDVSLCVRGGAVKHIEEFFIQLWNYLSDAQFGGNDRLEPSPPPPAAGTHIVHIARSVTPRTLTKRGERGILAGYRAAIRRAKDFIYLENQYFTNEVIVAELRHALRRHRELQLILVINQTPNVPLYQQLQNKSLKRLGLDVTRQFIDRPRIGVFTLWAADHTAEKSELQPCYIHSKVGIIDDEWMTIGSANLDDASLSGQEKLIPFFYSREQLSMELNAMLLDPTSSHSEIGRFRQALWSEHFGNIQLKRSADGWLAQWKRAAEANADAINTQNHQAIQGRVFPYSTDIRVQDAHRELRGFVQWARLGLRGSRSK